MGEREWLEGERKQNVLVIRLQVATYGRDIEQRQKVRGEGRVKIGFRVRCREEKEKEGWDLFWWGGGEKSLFNA